jgi:hypothetical protein
LRSGRCRGWLWRCLCFGFGGHGGRALLDARAGRGQDLVNRLRYLGRRGCAVLLAARYLGGRHLRLGHCLLGFGCRAGGLGGRLGRSCIELGARLGIGGGGGLLQRANGFLESQAMRLEQSGRRALAVPDDRCQHDRAIDLPPARLVRRLSRSLQHAQQLGIGIGLYPGRRSHVLEQATQIARGIGAEAYRIDIARVHDRRRIGIFGQGKQQVLEQHRTVRLLAREHPRPLQAFAEPGRELDRPQFIRKRLRH